MSEGPLLRPFVYPVICWTAWAAVMSVCLGSFPSPADRHRSTQSSRGRR